MSKIIIRFSNYFFLLIMVFFVPTVFALYIGVSNFISYGYFKQNHNTSFYLISAFFLFLLFLIFKVFPAYRVTLSDDGIQRKYNVQLFGLPLYQDKYGEAKWSDVEALDTYNIGWLWGLALFFRVEGHQRMVMLNLLYSNNKNAIRMILEHIPTHKITKEAMKKIRKLGIEVDRK